MKRLNLSGKFDLQRLIDMPTVCIYVSLSPNDVRDRIAAGKFPYINISRGSKPVFRFDVKELDKWIESLPGKKTEDLND